MKRLLTLFGICFFTLGIAAQEQKDFVELEGPLVQPPKFKVDQTKETKTEVNKSPICNFLEANMEYTMERDAILQEGVVIVEFTVNKDGHLSNIYVVNSINNQIDNSVITCLKKTDGMWIPGKVNSIPTPMEKRVSVRFDDPNNESFEVLAKNLYYDALKLYNRGIEIQNNKLIAVDKRDKKSERNFNNSLYLLKQASAYYPYNEAVKFWEASNYEKLGEEELMDQKLNEIAEINNHEENVKYLDKYDYAIIKF